MDGLLKNEKALIRQGLVDLYDEAKAEINNVGDSAKAEIEEDMATIKNLLELFA